MKSSWMSMRTIVVVVGCVSSALGQQWVGPTGAQNRLDYTTGNVYIGTPGLFNPVVRADVADDALSGRVITFHAFAGTPTNGVRTTAIWGETNNPAGRALQGFNFATTGAGAGIWAETASSAGTGLRARATSTTGNATGGFLEAAGVSGIGVLGRVTNTTVNATPIAVYGISDNATGYSGYFTGGRNYFEGNVGIGTATPAEKLSVTGGSGGAIVNVTNSSSIAGTVIGGSAAVSGQLTSTSAGSWATAVRGINSATGTFGVGVLGYHAGSGIGVYGTTGNFNGYAGFFEGNVGVNGTLSKSGGSFKIDHPLDPENQYLYHSFVESPDMMNIYNGTVVTDDAGYALITLPDYFEALNRDFRYQLTVIDEHDDTDAFLWAKVVRKVKDNTFTIRSSRPGLEVSWQVTGVRQDRWAQKHRIPNAVPKEKHNRGRYLHPDAFGKPESLRVSYQDEGKTPVQQKPAAALQPSGIVTVPSRIAAPHGGEPPLVPVVHGGR